MSERLKIRIQCAYSYYMSLCFVQKLDRNTDSFQTPSCCHRHGAKGILFIAAKLIKTVMSSIEWNLVCICPFSSLISQQMQSQMYDQSLKLPSIGEGSYLCSLFLQHFFLLSRQCSQLIFKLTLVSDLYPILQLCLSSC